MPPLRLLVLTLLVGCAAPPEPPPPPDAPSSAPDGTAPAPSSPDPLPPDAPAGDAGDAGPWTSGVVEQAHDRQPAALLTDLRIGAHPRAGFDRIVFQFDGPVPGYHVAYVDDPQYHCGSGEPVYLDGDAWLEVRLTPAAAHTEAGTPTLPDRRRAFDGPLLREAASMCDFEGHVDWVFGVSSPNPFRVTEVGAPSRLVVDIRR